MAQKLWEKNFEINKEIERFTVGRDREMDLYLAKYDVIGSMAHITMLESIGLLQADELKLLLAELRSIYALCESGDFVIEDGVEDVHSQVELMLTRKLGDIGKKIHSGRSRNDQVLVDLKLFTRRRLRDIVVAVKQLFDELIGKSEQYKDILMPGYTHLQIAMPSSGLRLYGLQRGICADGTRKDGAQCGFRHGIGSRNGCENGIRRMPLQQPEFLVREAAKGVYDRLKHHAAQEKSGCLRADKGKMQ